MEASPRKYVFTGGGTTGHVVPNLAMFGGLLAREPDARFLYIGSRSGHEAQQAPDAGIPFRAVPCAPFCSPRSPLRFARMVVRIVLGVLKALFILARLRPDVVIATGGYVAVPTTVAAWILGRRIYLHEQNVRPGLANRVLAHIATRVGVSFEESLAAFGTSKATFTGYPVRSQIGAGEALRARRDFGIPDGNRVALICGGSLGARSINRATVEALKPLMQVERISIVHVTGLNRSPQYHAFDDTRRRLARQGFADDVPGRYVCRSFIDGIQDVYAMADLVVARSGAGTVMELATVGKPSILVPKSDSPGNHQMLNALSLKGVGAADVLFEELTEEGGVSITRVRGDTLAQKIKDLLFREDDLRAMGERAKSLARRDAIEANVDEIRRLASGEPLIQRVTEMDELGFLITQDGVRHELLFRNTIVGGGLLADVTAPGVRGRFVLQRVRVNGKTEFHVVPRAGRITVGGETVEGRRVLAPGESIGFSGQCFEFLTQEQEVERFVRPSGMGAKVLFTSFGTLVSRLFGFVRAAATAAVLGLGSATDILAVGLQAANFFRSVFAEVAIDTAFLPTYIHLKRTGRKEAANRLFRSLLTWVTVGSAIVTVAALATLDKWLPWMAPGFVERGIIAEAMQITAIMFPYLILVSIAAVLSAVLRSFDRFGIPAISSVMFNVGILGGLAFYPWFGLEAVGVGVLVGGLGQVLTQLPPLLSPEVRRSGLSFRPAFDVKDPGVRKVARITPNVLADAGGQKLGSVVDSMLATPLMVGGVGALFFGMTIFRLPYGLISQSINTVLLKEISEGQAGRDRDWSRRLFTGGLNWTLFTLLPVSIGMIILAEPIVRLMFQYSSFSAADTLRVADVLRMYSIGLVGWGVTSLCGRFFAARMEQTRSTVTSFVALGLNVVLSIALVKLGMGIGGLALATSISFLFSAGLRVFLLVRSFAKEGVVIKMADVVPSATQSIVATAGAAVAMGVVYAAVHGFNELPAFLNRAFIALVPLGFGAFAFVASAVLVGSEQMDEIRLRMWRRRRPEPVRPDGGSSVNPYCLSPGRLLAWVESHPHAHLDYNFAGRVATLLKSSEWSVRNIGVKLIGRLRLQSSRYELCRLIVGREPAPLFDRVLGGDFVEPGFVRRNAIESLEKLGQTDEQVERALLTALTDPYFEVRAQAARVLGKFADQLSGPGREEAAVKVARATRDRNFEVARQAVRALGDLALDPAVVDDLKRLHYHPNWLVRDGVIHCYELLHRRRILGGKKQLLALLDDVLITTEGFRPLFPLKQNMVRFQEELLRKDEPLRPERSAETLSGGPKNEREADA